jgi:hypothetical protein
MCCVLAFHQKLFCGLQEFKGECARIPVSAVRLGEAVQLGIPGYDELITLRSRFLQTLVGTSCRYRTVSIYEIEEGEIFVHVELKIMSALLARYTLALGQLGWMHLL